MHTTWYFYDAFDRQMCVVDALADTSYAVNADYLNTSVSFTQPADSVATVYDAVGDVLSVTNALGNKTQYVYDNLGRKIEQIDPNPTGGGDGAGPTTYYGYDADGKLQITFTTRGARLRETRRTPPGTSTTHSTGRRA